MSSAKIIDATLDVCDPNTTLNHTEFEDQLLLKDAQLKSLKSKSLTPENPLPGLGSKTSIL